MPKQTDQPYTGVTYVALKVLKVDGTTRNPGDPVPEAANWRNLNNYLSRGDIAVVAANTTHPNIRSGNGHTGKAAGNREHTRYQPHDPAGTPSHPAADAT